MCHVPELVALVWLSCVCGAVAYPLSRRHISPPSSGLVDPKSDFAKLLCNPVPEDNFMAAPRSCTQIQAAGIPCAEKREKRSGGGGYASEKDRRAVLAVEI